MYIVVNNSISEPLKETLYFDRATTFTKIHKDKKEVLGGDRINLDLRPGDADILIEDLSK